MDYILTMSIRIISKITETIQVNIIMASINYKKICCDFLSNNFYLYLKKLINKINIILFGYKNI